MDIKQSHPEQQPNKNITSKIKGGVFNMSSSGIQFLIRTMRDDLNKQAQTFIPVPASPAGPPPGKSIPHPIVQTNKTDDIKQTVAPPRDKQFYGAAPRDEQSKFYAAEPAPTPPPAPPKIIPPPPKSETIKRVDIVAKEPGQRETLTQAIDGAVSEWQNTQNLPGAGKTFLPNKARAASALKKDAAALPAVPAPIQSELQTPPLNQPTVASAPLNLPTVEEKIPEKEPAPATARINPDFLFQNEPAQTEQGLKKILLFASLSILALILISGGLWFLVSRPATPLAEFSPTPTPEAATPTPPIAPSPLFKTDSRITAQLKTGQEKVAFQETMKQVFSADAPADSFTHLLFQNSDGTFPSLEEIASSTEIDIFDLPAQAPDSSLKELLDMNSFTFFFYSQRPAGSSPFEDSANQSRVGLAIAAKNSAPTEQLLKALKDIEQLMPRGMEILMPKNAEKIDETAALSDNVYKNIPIRYVNFPAPDLSFDYAIVNNLLVFATSKESMYAIIDKITSP